MESISTLKITAKTYDDINPKTVTRVSVDVSAHLEFLVRLFQLNMERLKIAFNAICCFKMAD
jgi:hypothetical protein